MAGENFGENFEQIDNESINQNIDKIEEFISKRIENKEILLLLNKMDKVMNGKDIDMSYNPQNKQYYIKIDGKLNPKGFSFQKLKDKFVDFIDVNEKEPSVILLDTIENIYIQLQKEPNSALEQKVQILEKQYYNKTGFPIPFNRNLEMFTPLD